MIITTEYVIRELCKDSDPRIIEAVRAGCEIAMDGYMTVSKCEFIGLPQPPAEMSHFGLRAPINPCGGWEYNNSGNVPTGWYDQHLVAIIPSDTPSS